MVSTVGVVGCGVIGSGWAARLRLSGIDVRTFDPSPAAADGLWEERDLSLDASRAAACLDWRPRLSVEQLHRMRGDIYCRIFVEVPTKLSEAEVELLTSYAEGRDEVVGNAKEGLFTRIKSAFS